MKKIILFGAGKISEKLYKQKKESVIAVIDNNQEKVGTVIWGGVSVISLNLYKQKYENIPIIISTIYYREIEEQLKENGIVNYSVSNEIWNNEDIRLSQNISHTKWPMYLKDLCDKEGKEVLEVGSRIVTGTSFRHLFEKSTYVGFDYYEGDNVDVVGDAHKLSDYFDKKFDLIFSFSVFEHLAMPWQVSLEMIKLLKPGGYIFIETHYSYSSHERPWHFFQFSENALNVLFPEKFGIKCIEKGCSNPIEGYFANNSAEYLRGRNVGEMFCHSEFLGQKIKDIPEKELTWDAVCLSEVVGSTQYPKKV